MSSAYLKGTVMEIFTVAFVLVLISIVLLLYFFFFLACVRKLEQHDIDISKVMEELYHHNFWS